jgi:hypothetical protein
MNKPASEDPGTPIAQPRRRRWLRVSLRTALLLMTLLAIWLGWIAQRAHRQAKAVRAIEKLGGVVQYDFHLMRDPEDGTEIYVPKRMPPTPPWLHETIGLDFFYSVHLVAFSLDEGSEQLSNADLATLAAFPRLRQLVLRNCPSITSEGLGHLATLRDMRGLWLQSCPRITDEGMLYVAQLRELRELGLGDTSITDRGLAHIADLQYVRRLNVSNTPITDEGLVHLRNYQHLAQLALRNCKIDGRGLVHIRHLPVFSLRLVETDVTDANLKHVGAMKKLHDLSISGPFISDAGLAHLSTSPSLLYLEIRGTNITDAGLQHLDKLRLREVTLYDNARLTASGAKRLEATLRWPAELGFMPSSAPAPTAPVPPVTPD